MSGPSPRRGGDLLSNHARVVSMLIDSNLSPTTKGCSPTKQPFFDPSRCSLVRLYSAVGLKTVGFPLAGTTVFKQSPL